MPDLIVLKLQRGRGRPRGSRNKSNLAFENSFVERPDA